MAGNEYDKIAPEYDATRGGERRGREYARYLASVMDLDDAGTVLEVGVGTGLVALGLKSLGFDVVGVDLSRPMLDRAHARLGSRIVQADACTLPIRSRSVTLAISIWVIHAVPEPVSLFSEVHRILHAGGRYLVCPLNRSTDEDPIAPAMAVMSERERKYRESARPSVTTPQIIEWAAKASFTAQTTLLGEQTWTTTAEDVIQSIERRSWGILDRLDKDEFKDVTAEPIAMLRSLPAGPIVRRAAAELISFDPR